MMIFCFASSFTANVLNPSSEASAYMLLSSLRPPSEDYLQCKVRPPKTELAAIEGERLDAFVNVLNDFFVLV